MPVHNIHRVPLPRQDNTHRNQLPKEGNPQPTPEGNCESSEWYQDNCTDKAGDSDDVGVELSEPQQQVIYSWSWTMFLKRYWVSQKICKFELLMHFLYDTVKENDMFVPAWLTWIDHIKQDFNDPDTYAARLLFMLLCSKRVKDINLSSLEEFVNCDQFSIDLVIQCGTNEVRNKICHLGLQNKNANDIIKIFKNIKLYQDKYKHFP